MSNSKGHLNDCISTLNNINRSLEDFIRNYENMKSAKANKYGRSQGKNNPNGDCRNLVNKYRPNGLIIV